MIEVPAQAGRVVTTDFKGFAYLMPGTAFPLHPGDGGYHFLSDSWIIGHLLYLLSDQLKIFQWSPLVVKIVRNKSGVVNLGL